MGKKVRWTDEAADWLEKVHDYIALDKPSAAQKLVKEVLQKAKLLEKFSEIGHHLSDFPKRNVRALLYGHYRIVYTIKDGEQIDILGVFHGALDLKKYLKFLMIKKNHSKKKRKGSLPVILPLQIVAVPVLLVAVPSPARLLFWFTTVRFDFP